MKWASKIKELLEDGLFVNNLRKIEEVAWEAVKHGQSKFPSYIVYKISGGLANYWDDIPLSVDEFKRVDDALRPPMRVLIDAVLSNASQAEIVASVEALIKMHVDTFRPSTSGD